MRISHLIKVYIKFHQHSFVPLHIENAINSSRRSKRTKYYKVTAGLHLTIQHRFTHYTVTGKHFLVWFFFYKLYIVFNIINKWEIPSCLILNWQNVKRSIFIMFQLHLTDSTSASCRLNHFTKSKFKQLIFKLQFTSIKTDQWAVLEWL